MHAVGIIVAFAKRVTRIDADIAPTAAALAGNCPRRRIDANRDMIGRYRTTFD